MYLFTGILPPLYVFMIDQYERHLVHVLMFVSSVGSSLNGAQGKDPILRPPFSYVQITYQSVAFSH